VGNEPPDAAGGEELALARRIPVAGVLFLTFAAIALIANVASIVSVDVAKECPKYDISNADRVMQMTTMTLVAFVLPGLPTFFVTKARGNAVIAAFFGLATLLGQGVMVIWIALSTLC
jgi:hypothetical protein